MEPRNSEILKQGVSAMKKFVMRATPIGLAMAIGIAMSIPSAYAAGKSKIDCDAVMQELNGGKKAKEVATDMKISTSSVYKCKKKEMAAAKTASKAGNEPGASPAASPATAPKP
jgi:hypothetical protein